MTKPFEQQKQITEQNHVQRQERELAELNSEVNHTLRNMPIKALKTMVASERPISGGKPHQPTAVPGDESRPMGMSSPRLEVAVRVSAKALQAARRQVAH